jgi:hypothetical protein
MRYDSPDARDDTLFSRHHYVTIMSPQKSNLMIVGNTKPQMFAKK